MIFSFVSLMNNEVIIIVAVTCKIKKFLYLIYIPYWNILLDYLTKRLNKIVFFKFWE